VSYITGREVKTMSKDYASNALCNVYDIKYRLSREQLTQTIDDDGTELTIEDILSDIIKDLERLENE